MMGRFWLFLFGVVFSFQSNAAVQPIEYSYGPPHDAASPDRLTYEGLKSWIRDRNIRDIDGLLASWQKHPRYSDFLKSFTLIYNSRSLQRMAVDPAHPRVIFHKDALFGAIVSNPAKPQSSRQMEIIEYETQNERWAFHAVEFPARASEEVRFEDHPTSCTECHGAKPRPIWGTYPMWPGAYGGADEFSQQEQRDFDRFVDSLKKPELARYRYFIQDSSSFARGNNIAMSMHVSFLNFNRMLGELKRSPVFPAYQYAVYAAAAPGGCGGIDSFLPEKIRKAHEKKLGMTLAQVLADTHVKAKAEYNERVRRYQQLHGANGGARIPTMFDDGYADQVGRVRFLVEGQGLDADLDMKLWSLSYEPGLYSYNFSTGHYGFTDFYERELTPYLKDQGVSGGRYSVPCDVLKQKSLEALGKL